MLWMKLESVCVGTYFCTYSKNIASPSTLLTFVTLVTHHQIFVAVLNIVSSLIVNENFLLFFLQSTVKSKPEPTLNELAKYSLGFLRNCSKPSTQRLFEGLLDHFFSAHALRKYIEEDVCWLLKQHNTTEMLHLEFSSQPSYIRCLKFYLSRILIAKQSPETPDSMNPLGIFDDKVSAVFFTCHICSNLLIRRL